MRPPTEVSVGAVGSHLADRRISLSAQIVSGTVIVHTAWAITPCVVPHTHTTERQMMPRWTAVLRTLQCKRASHGGRFFNWQASGTAVVQVLLAAFPVTGYPLVNGAPADSQLIGYFPGVHPLLHDPLHNKSSTIKRGSGILMMVVHLDLQSRNCDLSNHQSLLWEPCAQPL